ncbi:hypothetical protein DXG03_001310 [Asterophora parasitica]|uniref:Phosphoglycerate mutase-like protein n=1 Tax=Asterophora parasitica TaxID=117018 RepID=A0A9P7K9B0_9AGAR|nr:hypothetical protein DXG03_001310 [Asterophora parasitica]
MTILARVYLVRHGETNENRNKIIQGQLDTSLNRLGREQARLVGEALKSIPFEIAFSSDLSRAAKTAEAILAHHPHLTLQKQVELRERHMGEMQGKVWRQGQQASGTDRTIESAAFFAARAETWWIKYILDGTAPLPENREAFHILAVTHGGFIGTLVRSLVQGKKAVYAPGVVVERCLNSSVTIVEVNDGRQGVVIQGGDVSHLKGLEDGVETNVDDTAGQI